MGAAGLESPSEGAENTQIPAQPHETNQTKSPAAGIGEDSHGPGADLARAVKLAAEAGEWAIVAALARQLDLLAKQQGANAIRVLPGGKGVG